MYHPMKSDMLRCWAHTAVKSDEDDYEQGNHVLNYRDMRQGIIGRVTAGQTVQEYTSGMEMIY